MKTVAIIGAGASGLTAIKCCLEEGLEPTCFERTDDIGGLWNYTQAVRESQSCVMKSTVINVSKEMMCYSDYPIPKEYPVFMHNTYVQKYFQLYAKEFDLEKYIKFRTEVLHLGKADDFSTSGKWNLSLKNKATDETSEQTFDAVLVCTGHHAEKFVPDFLGLSDFKGKIVHTHDYKDRAGFENKKVVVIGIGNSGGDIAVELSGIAAPVYISTRSGTWINYRVSDKGMPLDMVNQTRMNGFLIKNAPLTLVNMEMKRRLNSRVDHAAYCLEPKYGPFDQHIFVNDDIANRIMSGSVIIKPNVKKITSSTIEFDNGTTLEDVDVIIMATGYIFGFPFIDKSIIDVQNNQVELYKYMFPPKLEKPTLSVIGCVQPIGSVMPISELQCRLATRVFKGDVRIPSTGEMMQDVQTKRAAMSKRYVTSQRHTLQVDYVDYMDQIATLAGCKPNIPKMFLTDPLLAAKCFFGPCSPYQFRLEGPGNWKGAREAILTQWDRTLYPLKNRPLGFKSNQNTFFVVFLFVTLAMACLIYFMK